MLRGSSNSVLWMCKYMWFFLSFPCECMRGCVWLCGTVCRWLCVLHNNLQETTLWPQFMTPGSTCGSYDTDTWRWDLWSHLTLSTGQTNSNALPGFKFPTSWFHTLWFVCRSLQVGTLVGMRGWDILEEGPSKMQFGHGLMLVSLECTRAKLGVK